MTLWTNEMSPTLVKDCLVCIELEAFILANDPGTEVASKDFTAIATTAAPLIYR